MSDGKKCWVPTCRNSAEQGYYNKKYHSLPVDLGTREIWIAVSGKSTESTPPEDIVFCEEHFLAQEVVKSDKKSYIKKNVPFPSKNMPDRMCRTCMSIIPPEQSFHIMSTKVMCEMPPSIKNMLSFCVSSGPEPLHHMFTFCLPELKIPRDPCQMVCNNCYLNIWLFFVFKITCNEVEKNLKGDMSWENYGKKVLCRCCIQTSGTNFIPLSPQSNMGILLRRMFVNDCPSPEIVPLQVCLICFNVLESLDQFNRNCYEVEEKMKRHIALQKKYSFNTKQLPSITANKFLIGIDRTMRISTPTIAPDTEFIPIPNKPSPQSASSKEQPNNVNLHKNLSKGTSLNDKLTLAQIMLKYGLPLKNDFYQQEIWSLICKKMQEKGIVCSVPGLINVWKEMGKESKRKFDLGETLGYIDDLVIDFHKKISTPGDADDSRSRNSKSPVSTENTSVNASTNSHNRLGSTLQKKKRDKKIPTLESIAPDAEKGKKLPINDNIGCADSNSENSGRSGQSWSEEMKLNFIKNFINECHNFASQRNSPKMGGKRDSYKKICTRLANSSDYKEYDGASLYRMWMAIRTRAAREKDLKRVTPLCKLVLALIEKEPPIQNTQLENEPNKAAESYRYTLSGKIDRRHFKKKKSTPPKTNEKPRAVMNQEGNVSGKKNPTKNAGKKTTTVSPVERKYFYPLEYKIALLDAIAHEYDASEEIDKLRKGLWRAIIRRAVIQVSHWNFDTAYSFWSRVKISALTHEKDRSDVLDNKAWKLLQKHEEFKKSRTDNGPDKNIEPSTLSNGKCKIASGDDPSIKQSNKQTVLSSNRNSDSKKRLSEETRVSGKKQRIISSISEEGRLALVKVLKKTSVQMYKEERSPIYWSAVIKRLFENGGYENLTLEEVDTIWNQMIFDSSKNKSNGTMTDLDKEVQNLMSQASESTIEHDRSLLLTKEIPNLQKADRVMIEAKNSGKAVSTVDPSDTGLDKVSSRIKHWHNDEKMALISAVMNEGDEVFKQGNLDKFWDKVHLKYGEKGFDRPVNSIRSYWYHLRKHAELVWANKVPGNEIDKVIISFMTNVIKPTKSSVNEVSESNTIENNQKDGNEDSNETIACVDLTYDYVSFDDIAKLAAETTEDEPLIKAEPLLTTECIEKGKRETFTNFVVAKVEGGVRFNYEENGEDISQDESVQENFAKKNKGADDEPDSDVKKSEKKNTLLEKINELEIPPASENVGYFDVIEVIDSDEG